MTNIAIKYHIVYFIFIMIQNWKDVSYSCFIYSKMLNNHYFREIIVVYLPQLNINRIFVV